MKELPPSRAHIATERPNPRSAELDRLSTAQALDVLLAEDALAVAAVAAERERIAAAAELVGERLARGGRLFYAGAGTSGRLAALDAAELPPTFRSDPSQVQAIVAGGEAALTRAVEGAEDDREAAGRELERRGLCARDVLLGISAGGTTPFVQGALAFARARGAATIFLACVPFEEAPDEAGISIRVLTGPEVVTGSTRLKAGTATKLVLNALSTLAMVRLGKVHGNRMVDVAAGANEKLRDRGIRLVAELCGIERVDAAELFERSGRDVKVAVVMQRRALDAQGARAELERAAGSLRRALED